MCIVFAGYPLQERRGRGAVPAVRGSVGTRGRTREGRGLLRAIGEAGKGD